MVIEHAHGRLEHHCFTKRIEFYGSSWLWYTGKTGKTTQFRVNFSNGNVLNFGHSSGGVVPVDAHFPQFNPIVGRAVRRTIRMGFIVAVTNK